MRFPVTTPPDGDAPHRPKLQHRRKKYTTAGKNMSSFSQRVPNPSWQEFGPSDLKAFRSKTKFFLNWLMSVQMFIFYFYVWSLSYNGFPSNTHFPGAFLGQRIIGDHRILSFYFTFVMTMTGVVTCNSWPINEQGCGMIRIIWIRILLLFSLTDRNPKMFNLWHSF